MHSWGCMRIAAECVDVYAEEERKSGLPTVIRADHWLQAASLACTH